MNRWSVLTVLLVAAAALALRLPKLDQRPLHNDEAVNAFKVTELWQQGRYAYDPDEYHGPTLHYFTLPFLWLSGAKDTNDLPDATLRLAPVFFGAGLILLLLLFRDALGRAAIIWAAVFTAISPAMVFYSRYFIHEMLLLFFTVLTIGSAWRYLQSHRTLWAVTTGAGLGLMAATKETFVITLAAIAVATAITAWWCNPGTLNLKTATSRWNWKQIGLAILTAAIIWLVFFSSFFTNPSGPLDSIRTYLPWLKRAGGESFHIHPWYFYFHRLGWFHPARSPVWSEGLVLGLAALGSAICLIGNRSPLHRFLAIYTIVLTTAYCLISYKTPWCLLSFYQGMILLAGVGAAELIRWCRRPIFKIVMAAILVALTLQLTWQSWGANFKYAADPRNPYVYAQTSPDLLKLTERIKGIAHVAPTDYQTIVKVITPDNDYWPMPWYLRRFKNVGWYDHMPDDPFAPVMVVSTQFNARLDDKSDRKWIMAGIYALRPGRFFELYVELELWKKYVETLPPPTD